MNASSDFPAHSESDREAQHQSEAIGNLFRLLQSSVQSTQLKLGGQMVVPAQDIVGVVVSAKADFDSGAVEESLQQLNQAADSFRHKIVRWEAAARTAQSRQSQLTVVQKRQLPAEISSVRTTARKAQLFFDRLLAAVTDWATTHGQLAGKAAKAAAEGDAAGQTSVLYQQVGYVPKEETARRVQMPTDGLTKMMVQQQFEELAKLLGKRPYRHLDLPLETALSAFDEGRYTTARTRLNEVHQAFLQAWSAKKFVDAELVDQGFRTLAQGISKFEEAAKSQREETSAEPSQALIIEQQPDPVDDLHRLRQLLDSDFDKVFPAGSPPEHAASAQQHLEQVVSGPLAELMEHLSALRHALTRGARAEAAEAKEAREILQRLLQLRPQEIRPGLEIHLEEDDFPLLWVSEPEEDGITLSFEITSTELFTFAPVDLRQSAKIELKFRNASPDVASVQFQLYNAADEPILRKAESVRLPRSAKITKGRIASPLDKINPRIVDSRVVSVEFMNIPDDVEIAELAFRNADSA